MNCITLRLVTYFRLLNNLASNKKKLDEFESKWTNLQTTFLHGGLDIIGELKEKLNGLINQFEGFKNKSEEQFGELKAGNPKTQYFFFHIQTLSSIDLKVKQHDISQNSLKIEKRVLELKLKLEGENSKIEENNKSLLHKIKENSQMIIGLRWDNFFNPKEITPWNWLRRISKELQVWLIWQLIRTKCNLLS